MAAVVHPQVLKMAMLTEEVAAAGSATQVVLFILLVAEVLAS
jgi:hypothetical protein